MTALLGTAFSVHIETDCPKLVDGQGWVDANNSNVPLDKEGRVGHM